VIQPDTSIGGFSPSFLIKWPFGGKSPFFMGKLTISTGPCSIAMLNYQRVYHIFRPTHLKNANRVVLHLPFALPVPISISHEFLEKISHIIRFYHEPPGISMDIQHCDWGP